MPDFGAFYFAFTYIDTYLLITYFSLEWLVSQTYNIARAEIR